MVEIKQWKSTNGRLNLNFNNISIIRGWNVFETNNGREKVGNLILLNTHQIKFETLKDRWLSILDMQLIKDFMIENGR